MSDFSDNGLQEVVEMVEPYIETDVDSETGLVVYKYRLPPEVRAELLQRAHQEHISLRELIDRAINIYLALDISGQKPGTYYTRHVPGEPPERIIFPFWPFRRKLKKSEE